MVYDNKYKAWLAELKVGDTVMIQVDTGWKRSIATPYKIDRMTPTMGIVKVNERIEYRFRIEDGKIIGQTFARVEEPVPERMKAYRDHKVRTKFTRAIENLNGNISDVSIEVMEELADRLHAEADRAMENREKRIAHEKEMKAKRGY